MSDAIFNAPGRFDFGLSAAQEERARLLHHESVVIDLLSQHAGGNIIAHYPQDLRNDLQAKIAAAGSASARFAAAEYWPYDMAKLGRSSLLHEWYRTAGLTCGSYGLSVAEGDAPESREWGERIAGYAALPWLRYVTTVAEIRQAKRDGVIAFYANCQPVAPIPRNLAAIDAAYARGLRSLTLTYNRMDHVGVGCTERVDAGLSMYGLEVVKRCNDLGIAVDVSHCGHLTTMDACRYSKKPVNANHTAARSVYPHARGKSDEALRAIAETGGVIGVVAVPAFLTDSSTPTIEDMLDHIDCIASLVGWQHVAIGTDWPLQAPDSVLQDLEAELMRAGFREQDRLDLTVRLAGFDDCRDLPNVARGLVKRGYSDEQIRGVLGENALRVFADVWGG